MDRKRLIYVFGRPGDDLLSQVLRHSTIGAEAFDGRVRDGIGSDRFAEGHQAGETHIEARVFPAVLTVMRMGVDK